MFAKEYSNHSKFFFNVYMYQIPLQRKQHCKHNSNNSLDKNIILKYKTVSFLKNISCTEWAFSIHQDILESYLLLWKSSLPHYEVGSHTAWCSLSSLLRMEASGTALLWGKAWRVRGHADPPPHMSKGWILRLLWFPHSHSLVMALCFPVGN